MTEATRSARNRLLRRGRRGRDGEWAQLALELGGVEAGAGSGPVARGELEVTVARPVGEYAEQVAQVGLGIEVVQPGRGDEGHQVAGGLAVVVTADEEPGLAASSDAAQLALGVVVGQAQAAIVEEACQRATLAVGVAECGAQQPAAVLNACVLDGDPREERVGVRPQVQLAERLDLVGRLVAPRPVEIEDALDGNPSTNGV